MTFPINPYKDAGFWTNSLGLNENNSFWGTNNSGTQTSDLWSFVSEQNDYKVQIGLEKVGQRMVMDLAEETAGYLVDKDELAEDYVIVVTEEAVSGRQARVYRKSEILANIEDQNKKEEMEKNLSENTLLYFNSSEGLPDTPDDDPELQGLADKVQAFLDKNEKILDLLGRSGINPLA